MKRSIIIGILFTFLACASQNKSASLTDEKSAEFKPPVIANNVLYLLDDKPINQSEFEKIDPNQIESINVIKDKEQIKKYTVGDYEGMINIHLKKRP